MVSKTKVNHPGLLGEQKCFQSSQMKRLANHGPLP